MKKYTFEFTASDYTLVEGVVYVGTAQDIMACYKSCERAYYNMRSNCGPLYNMPTLKADSMYGLVFMDHDLTTHFYVENSDTVLRGISNGFYIPT